MKRDILNRSFFYGTLALASLIALHIVTHVFSADIRIPYPPFPGESWSGDLLPIYFHFKAILAGDFGPFTGIHSERLGFPFMANWNDYPTNHSLFFLMIKCIGFFTSDWRVAFNIYWIITFPLTAVAAGFLFRSLKIRTVYAFSLALLYAMAPYHFYRLGHLWLASYFMVPLQVYVILLLWRKNPIFFGRAFKKVFGLRIAVVLILLLSAWAGVYYAAFFCILGGILALAAALKHGSWRHIAMFSTFVAITFTGVLADSIPFLSELSKNGANQMAKARLRRDVEVYGFKPIQLLLPIPDHRLPILASQAQKYRERSPLTNENQWAALGLVGAGGLIFLLGIPILRRRFRLGKFDALSQMTYVAMFTGTIGGLGALLGYTLFGSLRCYNRISIFLALFALTAIGIFISQLKIHKFVALPLSIFIFFAGIWDQTSRNFRYDRPSRDISQEIKFYSELEGIVSTQAVYQLPALTMPESTQFGSLEFYDPFKGYMFTEKTKWSFGNFIGRYANALVQNISYQEVSGMVRDLKILGFSFALIDGNGYRDNGTEINRRMTALLGKPILFNPEKRLSLFRLPEAKLGSSPSEILNRRIAYSIIGVPLNETINIGQDFLPEGEWRVDVYNPTTKPIFISIELSCLGVAMPNCGHKSVVNSTDPNAKIFIENSLWHMQTFVPPGKSELTFTPEKDGVKLPLTRFRILQN